MKFLDLGRHKREPVGSIHLRPVRSENALEQYWLPAVNSAARILLPHSNLHLRHNLSKLVLKDLFLHAGAAHRASVAYFEALRALLSIRGGKHASPRRAGNLGPSWVV